MTFELQRLLREKELKMGKFKKVYNTVDDEFYKKVGLKAPYDNREELLKGDDEIENYFESVQMRPIPLRLYDPRKEPEPWEMFEEDEEEIPKEILEGLNESYHFVIILDKNYKAKVNALKNDIYKLVNSTKFRVDYTKALHDAYKNKEMLGDNQYEWKKLDSWFFPELIEKWRLPKGLEFLPDLMLECGDKYKEKIIENLNDIVINSFTYESYFNQLIYMFNFENLGVPNSKHVIRSRFGDYITKTDINHGYLVIKYFQDKYFRENNKVKRPKFDFDKYLLLQQLDEADKIEGSKKLTDCEKADIVFGIDFDDFPSMDDEKKNIALLRVMRTRIKKYLKNDK